MPRTAFPCLKQSCKQLVSRGLQCAGCRRWAHPKCTPLKAELNALYKQHPELQWVCEKCIGIAQGMHLHQTEATLPMFESRSEPKQRSVKKTFAEAATTRFTSTPAQKSHSPVRLDPRRRMHISNKKSPLQPNTITNELKMIQDRLDKIEYGSLKNGINRTVLVLNKEEPLVQEAKIRRDMDRRRVVDILRMANLPILPP